ncbi:MAG: DUF1573 domain-containing protein [Bacteroidetes bacterium]|nr:DUF1573 domain-containing protein [Bacteroidota bacterium]MDA0950315.1 DUF1573 domain-containing protein [Bacteroidota bacterium]
MKNSMLFSLALSFSLLAVNTSCGDTSKKTSKESEASSAMPAAAATDGDVQTKFARMSFDKVEHDFGAIRAGAPQETVFTFKNIGDAPLIITNARSSCGCTVPDYPRNTPIAPGESGELLVMFNGTGVNQVTKSITLTTNTKAGTETLRIKAFVEPEGSTAFDSPLKK